MKINRFLASCGLGSRRKCEQLVEQHIVKVNGKIIEKLAVEISPDDIVTVNGEQVLPKAVVTIMLHKPKGYVCTNSDEKGRKTVFDLLHGKYKTIRLFCVGRLDYNTEGLLLMTNDGELANKITHPTKEVPKTYLVKTEKQLTEQEMAELSEGVLLDGIKTKKSRIDYIGKENNTFKYEVCISEGKNRQVRRMFESIDKEVVFLKRIAIGDLCLGGVSRGSYRELHENELAYLKNL